ncbi:hypothetical protein FHS32_001432 [Streptomyces albaduncus]|uniref:Secreted protein n=1 Tax=Streptomyces griseoloalbus TaxID=67303 RepID=A0A7W8F832_9ACTN|nr:hypothetical protein [Streptomyces albaduncus]MBB5124700.1 hypothetical protein [Streptomyces albaduncus]GGV72555.1 hypothetical protein GCM10010294_33580 [Streptomyces griseoloalbus]
MRKYQKAFVVVAMLGSVGTLGAGTAQAGGMSTNHGVDVCQAVGGSGGSASGGIGINALNINLIGDQMNSAGDGMGGAGGNASCS